MTVQDAGSPPTRSRWVMLGLVVSVGLFLVVVGVRAWRWNAAVEAVRDARGRVFVEFRSPNWLRRALGDPIRPIPLWDRVRWVHMDPGGELQSDVLVRLRDLAGFDDLSLWGPMLNDTHMHDVARLKGLKDLQLLGTLVGDSGIEELASLRDLRELSLVECPRVTDQALTHLVRLKKLETLELDGTSITDDGVKTIAGIRSLKSLSVQGTNVTEHGLEELARLRPDLQVLDD